MSEPASRQISGIYRYIARDSIQGAENVIAAIDAAINLLIRHPKMGRRTLRRNTRMFAVPDYPYLIFFQYMPKLDELRIRSVRHASRRRIVGLRDPEQEFRPAALS